jgi:hypothetical protein
MSVPSVQSSAPPPIPSTPAPIPQVQQHSQDQIDESQADVPASPIIDAMSSIGGAMRSNLFAAINGAGRGMLREGAPRTPGGTPFRNRASPEATPMQQAAAAQRAAVGTGSDASFGTDSSFGSDSSLEEPEPEQ